MNSIIAEILVDLFCSFDQEISPKFANLSREEKLKIALEKFAQLGWAKQVTNETNHVHWQSTTKLAREMKMAGRRFTEFPSQSRLTTTNESAEEYAKCMATVIRHHRNLTFMMVALTFKLKSRGIMYRACSENWEVEWVPTPKGLFVGIDDHVILATGLEPTCCMFERKGLMARRIDSNAGISWWPTAEGLAQGLGNPTGDGYELAEKLLGLDPGSLKQECFKQADPEQFRGKLVAARLPGSSVISRRRSGA